MNSVQDVGSSPTGFPIRTPPDQRLLSTSPKIFAASHVLHRLYAPRHSPSALSSLTITYWSRSGVEDQPVPLASNSPVNLYFDSLLRLVLLRARLSTVSRKDAREMTRSISSLENLNKESSRQFIIIFSFQRTCVDSKLVSGLELIGIEPTASGLQSPRSPS
jgi:hypothetical protein